MVDLHRKWHNLGRWRCRYYHRHGPLSGIQSPRRIRVGIRGGGFARKLCISGHFDLLAHSQNLEMVGQKVLPAKSRFWGRRFCLSPPALTWHVRTHTPRQRLRSPDALRRVIRRADEGHGRCRRRWHPQFTGVQYGLHPDNADIGPSLSIHFPSAGQNL